jgi:hypothetical protein
MKALALSLRGVVVDPDHVVVIVCKQVVQLGPEGAPGLLPQPAEEGESRLATLRAPCSDRTADPSRGGSGAAEPAGERLSGGMSLSEAQY